MDRYAEIEKEIREIRNELATIRGRWVFSYRKRLMTRMRKLEVEKLDLTMGDIADKADLKRYSELERDIFLTTISEYISIREDEPYRFVKDVPVAKLPEDSRLHGFPSNCDIIVSEKDFSEANTLSELKGKRIEVTVSEKQQLVTGGNLLRAFQQFPYLIEFVEEMSDLRKEGYREEEAIAQVLANAREKKKSITK